MPRITYTEDFKREAVRLVTVEGLSRKQVARDLGVSVGSLRDWIHRLAPEGPTVSEKLPEAEQLRQLKREVERLRMERDILKKAVGTTTIGGGFSQMPPKR
jgi:transposase